jgi:hypothetical protein
MGRLAEAREILGRLRAISSVVIPDADHLRNVEHRELFLSGLRLASGADSGITAAPPRVEFSRGRGPRHYGEAAWNAGAICRRSQIPAPTVDQARRHVGPTRHVAHHCTGFERRRDNRLLLLDASPATPLGTGQYLDTRHCTVSCTGSGWRSGDRRGIVVRCI